MPDPVTTPDVAPVPAAEPWLARAERILGGDVRPDDYLLVTPEVAQAVAFEMGFVRTHRGPVAPEVEGRQMRQALLCFHHGGQDIATLLGDDTDPRVIVLAVGLDAIGQLLRGRPPKERSRIAVQVPDVW